LDFAALTDPMDRVGVGAGQAQHLIACGCWMYECQVG